MNIEKHIKKRAPDDGFSDHDTNYANCLREAYNIYKDMDIVELKTWQKGARERYRRDMGTHKATAACVVINELIKEKEEK